MYFPSSLLAYGIVWVSLSLSTSLTWLLGVLAYLCVLGCLSVLGCLQYTLQSKTHKWAKYLKHAK